MAVPWFRYQEGEEGEKRGAKHAANGGIIIKGALCHRVEICLFRTVI